MLHNVGEKPIDLFMTLVFCVAEIVQAQVF